MNQGLSPIRIRTIPVNMSLISRRTRIWKNEYLKVILSSVMAKISKIMPAENYAKAIVQGRPKLF